jgi:hypothetical protein
MRVGRGMGYDGEGGGIFRTWSVLIPSLLHYPHTHPIATALYLLVMLIDAKMLEKQHRELSDPATAHACFLITSSLPSTRRAHLGGRVYSATRVRFDIFGRKDRYSKGSTRVDPLPVPSRTYGQPHTYLITPTTTSAREDVKDDAKMRLTRSSNTLHTVTRSGGDCNIDEGSTVRQWWILERSRRDKLLTSGIQMSGGVAELLVHFIMVLSY